MRKNRYTYNGTPLSTSQLEILRSAHQRTRCVYNPDYPEVRGLVDLGLMTFHPSPAWFPGGFIGLTKKGRAVVEFIENAEKRAKRGILHGAN